MKKLALIPFLGLLIFFACNESEVIVIGAHAPDLPVQMVDYESIKSDLEGFVLPSAITVGNTAIETSGQPSLGNVFFGENFNARATLGRVLFYDNRMSRNNSIACASCHKQELAFADDTAMSFGFGGKETIRNSMSIVNPMMNSTFFWDGRSRSLEDLALRPVFLSLIHI